ncbi:heavy metal-associated isoprenylated plant protein 35 [Cajanus cajan]|nr:heavy metal-associated isoprenylated plant protein 35 [Cajanus cajan]
MDAKPPQLASQPLNYQTWFLKVSIHCEGCRRKVKKVLKSIDGVFTATIDQQQQKVTVTGSVSVETLLRKLVRAGKHAEIWPESLNGDGKISGKGGNKNKKNEAKEPLKNKGTENVTTSSSKCNSENKSSNKKAGDNSPEKPPSGVQAPAEGGGGGSGKKKKKVQSGGNGLSSASTAAPAHTGMQFQDLVGQVNETCQQQSFSYPETGYPPMVYVASYNRFYPSYYVPSSPYVYAGLQDGYHFQSAPLVSFEIFSDENANGCSVM